MALITRVGEQVEREQKGLEQGTALRREPSTEPEPVFKLTIVNQLPFHNV